MEDTGGSGFYVFGSYPICCLLLWQNVMVKLNLRNEKSYLDYTSKLEFIIERSQGMNSRRDCEGMLLTGLFPWFAKPTFLYIPVLPAHGWQYL